MKSFQGITSVVHKDNVRTCPERHAQQWSNLPLSVKNILGHPFETEAIAKAIQDGKIPEFYLDKQPILTPPTTRSRSRQQVLEQNQSSEQPGQLQPADLSESDDDDDDLDVTPNTSKTVRFNV